MLINGYEYSWEDVNITIFGKLLTGVTEVEYTSEKQHTNIYGRGADPVAMGRGNKTYTGRLMVNQSELESILQKLPKGKDITDVTGTKMVVAYAPEGGKITTDIIQNVRFTSMRKGLKQGDGNMGCELPFIAGKILYNQ